MSRTPTRAADAAKMTIAPYPPTGATAEAGGRRDGPQAPQGFSEPDFSVVVQAIIHNIRTILGVAFVGAVVAFFMIRAMTPVFTASALIIIDTRTSLLDDAPSITGLPIADAYIENEIELIRSDAILHKVVEREDLFNDSEFAGGETPIGIARMARNLAAEGEAAEADAMLASVALMQVSDKIRRRLNVRRRGLSHAVEISFTSRSQTKARDVVNAVAAAYVEDQLATKRAASAKATDWLRAEVARLAQETQSAERAVEDYRARNTLIGEGDNGSSAQQLRSLTGELAAARVRHSELQVALDQLEKLRAEGGSAALLPAIAARPAITDLRMKLSEAEREIAEMRSRYNAENVQSLPVFAEVEARRAALQTSLDAEVEAAVAGVKADAAAARSLMASLEAELQGLKKENARLNAAGLGLAELERAAEAKRQLYETLLAEYNEADNVAAAQTSNARIISPAKIPLTPSAPRKKAVFAAAVVFSAAAGFFVAFLKEFMRRGIRTPEEFSALTNRRLGAMVPRIRARSEPLRAAMSARRRAQCDPHGAAVTALARTLREDCAGGGEGARRTGTGRVIALTAPAPRESAAPLAAAMARALSHAGEKILLVDLDLARPQVLPRAFRGRRGADLADVLDGTAAWRGALARRRRFGARLAVLGARAGAPAPASSAAYGERLEALLCEWRGAFDAVVVAAPPIAFSPLARIALRAADGTVLALRWERTDRRNILGALEACAAIDVSPTPVLCDVPPRAYAYHQGEDLWSIAVGPALARPEAA